jgi:hypothetical protein
MTTTAPPPLLAITARPVPDEPERTERRLRLAGIAVLVAAAVGSLIGASPAMTDTPSTDDHCRLAIVDDSWSSTGCAEEPNARR